MNMSLGKYQTISMSSGTTDVLLTANPKTYNYMGKFWSIKKISIEKTTVVFAIRK
jgi:hypothetical protein